MKGKVREILGPLGRIGEHCREGGVWGALQGGRRLGSIGRRALGSIAGREASGEHRVRLLKVWQSWCEAGSV